MDQQTHERVETLGDPGIALDRRRQERCKLGAEGRHKVREDPGRDHDVGPDWQAITMVRSEGAVQLSAKQTGILVRGWVLQSRPTVGRHQTLVVLWAAHLDNLFYLMMQTPAYMRYMGQYKC